MNSNLCSKIVTLSPQNQNCFYKSLYDILNDRYSSLMYGMKSKDYNILPKEKVESVEEKLYKEMFENINEKKEN